MATDDDGQRASDQQRSPAALASVSWFLTRMLVIALCVTTVGTLFAHEHWLADLLANLRLQQLIGLLAALVLCSLHRRWLGLALVAGLVAIHLPTLGSTWSNDNTRKTDPNTRLSITSANVLTRNSRHGDIITDLTRRDPSVIVVLELSSTLAARLTAEISQSYPYAVVRPQDMGNFGIGVFSKIPLRDQEVFTLNLNIESIAATVTIADQAYRIFATHSLPPMGASGFADRNVHLQQLAQRITSFQSQSPMTPVVLVGDLNLTPWSPLFADFERSSGLVRACPAFELTPTWYRFQAFPFGLVLDHGLISEQLRCVGYAVGPDIGSDHRSITLAVAATAPP